MLNPTFYPSGYVCCYCENEMAEDEIICCDTYKGKMTVQDFNEYYG